MKDEKKYYSKENIWLNILIWIFAIFILFTPYNDDITPEDLIYISGTRERFGHYQSPGKGSSYYFQLKLSEFNCWFEIRNPKLSEFDFYHLRKEITIGDSVEFGLLPESYESLIDIDTSTSDIKSISPITFRTNYRWVGSLDNYKYWQSKNYNLAVFGLIIWGVSFIVLFICKIPLEALCKKHGLKIMIVALISLVIFMKIP